MQPRTHPAVASQHYRMLELKSRVESAGPHGLVGMLYEELLRSLDIATASADNNRVSLAHSQIGKAISILVALETSLDFDKGGELALTLSRIYRACRSKLNDVARTGDTAKVAEIRNAVSEIAYAWQALSTD
jgi:flagellar secretion chaperone FliS